MIELFGTCSLEGGLLLGWEAPQRATALNKRPVGRVPVWHDGEGHLISIAPTGAGKGVSCIIPALLSWDGPAIVVDPKGENYAVTASRREAMGQRVILLDPFDVTGAGAKDALNPLDLLDPASLSFADDAATLARLLSQGQVNTRDPFWDERAEALVAGLIAYIAKHSPPPLRTLSELRYLIEQSISDLILTAEDMRRSPDPEIRMAANIVVSNEQRVRASIISSAASHVSFLRSGSTLSSLSASTFSLKDVLRGAPLSIYIVMPPDKLRSHAKLLRLWIGVFMNVLARRRNKPKRSTLFLIDEASQLGSLEELRTALTLMRGYGVKVWSFWQDLSQLAQLYPDDWKSLLNNCAVQQFFGATSPHAAAEIDAYLSGALGRPIARLKPNEMALVRQAHQPEILERPNYLKDRPFSELASQNPFHVLREHDVIVRRQGERS